MKKTLLLNSSYQPISFIGERKVWKLLWHEKVEVIASWDDIIIPWGKRKINQPSILKLKRYVGLQHLKINFNRYTIIKRDNYLCQYCGVKLNLAAATIDHVLPKSKGGLSNFTNCVASCSPCNNYKGDKTLVEAKMHLLKKPLPPIFSATYFMDSPEEWHEQWHDYF